MMCHLMIIESNDLKTKTFLVMAYPTQASGYPNSQEPKTKQSSPWWSLKLPPGSEQGVKGVCGDHVHLVALVICVEAGPGQKFCNQWLSSINRLSLLDKRLKLMRNICQSSQVGNGGENFGIFPKSCQKRGIVIRKLNRMHRWSTWV